VASVWRWSGRIRWAGQETGSGEGTGTGPEMRSDCVRPKEDVAWQTMPVFSVFGRGIESPAPTWRKRAFWETPIGSPGCYLTLNQVVILEVEETEVARTQELQWAVSSDGGRTYRELLRQ